MKRNNVKLLIERYRSTSNQIQNSSPSVVEAIVHRDGLRAVDSGDFIIPTGVPVSEGDIVKWIQDDADVTHLRSCYLFQGSYRDEGGWEADADNDPSEEVPSQNPTWANIGSSGELTSPAGANKFKGLIRQNTNSESVATGKSVRIPNKLMYVNKTVSGGNTTANVHDFDGDFEINMWVTENSSHVSTKYLFAKVTGNSASSNKRIYIRTGSGGIIRAEMSDGTNTVTLETTKTTTLNGANFIRLTRKGNVFSLWLINGTESSASLFNTPDATATNSSIGQITTTEYTVIGDMGSGNYGYKGLIHAVRIYCGGVLSLADARSLYKARAAAMVMKLAGIVWKIVDNTQGKKISVSGFGKVIPETQMDTSILNSGTEDSDVPSGNDSLNRVKNVYKEEVLQNIVYSLFKKVNVANTASASGSATSFNNFCVGWATPNESEDITEFIAEGNMLGLIKILMVRAVQQQDFAENTSITYSFYISPRGVVVVEGLGVDRGITFNHDPYNIQVNAADDTYVANDITIFGRIPTKTVIKTITGQALDTAISLSSEIGASIPLAVRIYNSTDSEWLKNSGNTGKFDIDREGRAVTIDTWNSGSGTKNIEIHVDYEYIDTGGDSPNLKQFTDDTSITNIGRYKKRIFIPQLTDGVEIIKFGYNLLYLTRNINKRYKVKAPFLVNFIRENHTCTVKNTLKNINATGQIVKSIHWHYPKNETIIELGEHEADAYDLVVGSNETINSLTAQTLKSMNR